jgi:hypothetical protein
VVAPAVHESRLRLGGDCLGVSLFCPVQRGAVGQCIGARAMKLPPRIVRASLRADAKGREHILCMGAAAKFSDLVGTSID